MKTVLYLQSSLNVSNLCELAGVRTFARSRGWRLVVRSVGAAASEKRAGLVVRRPSGIAEIVSAAVPDGIVVDGGAMSECCRATDFNSLPTVFLDRCQLDGGEEKCVCIRSDPRRVSVAAFEELSRFGYGDYAFVPWVRPFQWSVERGAEFSRLVAESGARFHPFAATPRAESFERFVRHVKAFVAALPRPCGVFAVNDVVGECVLEVIGSCGLRVPGDFAVVGVDNDREVCENAEPTLSSIALDFRTAGMLGAEALDALMDGREPSGAMDFGTLGVVHRMSTRRFRRKDPRVELAVEYLRRHVCEGLRVADVVQQMNCSRRLAELRFREVTGGTILGCIRQMRRESAERLLRDTDFSIAHVAESCGYATAGTFRKDFLSQTGISPREFRRRLRKISDN